MNTSRSNESNGSTEKMDAPTAANSRTTSSTPTPTPAPKRKLPPFLDHFNARDLKILFRCSVAFWVASLLIFIDPALRAFGSATFFACLALLFLPPSGVVLVFLLGATTMILGMALAWAWGVITMKAAFATRPAAETMARLQLLQQESVRLANSTAYPPASVLVYEGFMLDTRVSVTFFCMMGLFIYLLARLRMKAPKLTLLAIFGMIVSDVFLSIGPLLPQFSGTIPQVFLKPAAAAIAIGLSSSVLIFPESTSHMVLAGMHKLNSTAASSMSMTVECLQKYPADTTEVEKLQGLRMALIAGWGALEPAMGFLQFDVSFGHWNAQDIANLREPIRQVLLNTLGLLDLEILGSRNREKANRVAAMKRPNDGEKPSEQKAQHEIGRHQLMESLNLLESMSREDVKQSILRSYQALLTASEPLLSACRGAFESISDGIHQNNTRRWFGRMALEELQQMHRKHEVALELLREEMSKFSSIANNALLESHKDAFDEAGHIQDAKTARSEISGMFVGFIFEDRLFNLATALETALAQTNLLEAERTRRRIWFPTGLRHFASWALGKSSTPALQVPTNQDLPVLDKTALKEMQERLKSTSKPIKRRNKLSSIILDTTHWFGSEEGVFGLRVLIVTIAVGVIAVNRNTAGFFYRERGIWALIMAQTGLVPYLADFTYAFVTRVAGTLLGGILGMLGWYIGSGHGPGNPYGLAAVMAVASVMLMWLRLYAPPQMLQAAIMTGATLILVVGYSYIDTHTPSYGNPGVGYEVFWRRTVLVLVGFGAAFIVSLTPWPSSQSRWIAKALSEVLHAETDHYAVILSSWHSLDEDKRLLPAVESSALHLSETLSALGGPIQGLRWEFSSSAFDEETCGGIKKLCELMNEALARLHIRAVTLPPHLRQRFANASGMLDHRSIADVMAVLGIVEQALKTGDALPSILPTPLLKRCLEHGRGHVEISRDALRDEAVRGYCVAMSSYLGFLSAVDELVLVLKGALGESHHVPEDLAKFV